MANKQPMTDAEKYKFIDFLARSTPEEINDYIKKNGKTNNTNDRLFVFQWDRLKKKKDPEEGN